MSSVLLAVLVPAVVLVVSSSHAAGRHALRQMLVADALDAAAAVLAVLVVLVVLKVTRMQHERVLAGPVLVPAPG